DELLLDQQHPPGLLAREMIGGAGAVDAAADDHDVRRPGHVYHDWRPRQGRQPDRGPRQGRQTDWGPRQGPQTPRRSERPGVAVALLDTARMSGVPIYSSLTMRRPCAVGSSIAMPASQCGLNCVGIPNQLTQSSRIAGG